MHINRLKRAAQVLILTMASVMLLPGAASAKIEGITGTAFNFEAKVLSVLTGEGRSIFSWGFADLDGLGQAQYPGPTLLLTEGDVVTIVLTNSLPVNVSMDFPGMDAVGVVPDADPTDEVQGLIAWEVMPGGSATYTFTATNAGTYYYQSATEADVQVEMGLFGAIIVYPAGVTPGDPGPGRAYSAADDPAGDSLFDREYLFLVSEMDDAIHNNVRYGRAVDTTGYFPVYWFFNGRTAPDTLLPEGALTLRRQPYNCLPRMHPGERLLMRVIGIGRAMHPFHTHGNHMRIIARDGRLLQTGAGASADLSTEVFTITTSPGETADTIFQWTGEGLGFDIYGPDHGALIPGEDAAYHGIPIPTPVPDRELITFGDFFEGSPYLGGGGALPPGVGGFNPNMAYTFMWHSHNEKEMVNNNVFPGGMMTLLFVEHPGVVIDPLNP